MGKFAFWVLFVACLLAAGGLYAIKVRGNVAAIHELEEQVKNAAIDARGASGQAMGESTRSRLINAQSRAAEALQRAHRFFADRDALNIDLWFPELGTAWKKTPKRPEFQKQYSLAVDVLTREISAELQQHGVRTSSIAMIDYPWRMRGADPPPTRQLRELQRVFWLEDRLHRSLARFGGRLLEPLRLDSVAPALGRADAIFNGSRWIAVVECAAERVPEVLHAFDTGFRVRHEDGQFSDINAPVIVNDVSVAALDLDADQANMWLGTPPVRITFFLTSLDYKER